MEKGPQGSGRGSGTPLPEVAEGPLLCQQCCTHPALLLAGFGHQATEPTMLRPSLKTSLWFLILTGECCGWGGVCRIGPHAGMLPWDAHSGARGKKGAVPWGHTGTHRVLQAHLCLLTTRVHGLMLTQSYGGCKVPTCFMLMMPSWVEGGDLCRGSTARSAQPLADTQEPTLAGHYGHPPHNEGFGQTPYIQ